MPLRPPTLIAEKRVTLLGVIQGVLTIQRQIEAEHRHKLLQRCQCRICQLAREAADLLTEAYASATGRG